MSISVAFLEHELNKNLGLELCTYSLSVSQPHLLIRSKTHPPQRLNSCFYFYNIALIFTSF